MAKKRTKRRAAKKTYEEGPIKKLEIEISYYKKPDGSDVSIQWKGKTLNEVLDLEGPEFRNINDAIHDILAELGPIGPGRNVVVRSTP